MAILLGIERNGPEKELGSPVLTDLVATKG